MPPHRSSTERSKPPGTFPLPVRGYHGGGCSRGRLRGPAWHEGRGECAQESPAPWRKRSRGAPRPPSLSHLASGATRSVDLALMGLAV